MTMHTPPRLTPDELRARAVRFYDRYGRDLEQIKSLLQIRLEQLALAHTINQKLPPEAIRIATRVKTLPSFLKKLERKGWPQFYYPTEVAEDLIGARAVCWFCDDCYGFVTLLRSSKHVNVDPTVEDFISTPKKSGYRSIHLRATIAYDGIRRDADGVTITSEDMPCEIQVRTKLQDAWGDITHEFHYKAKDSGVDNRVYEDLLCDVAERLATEDRTLIKFRDAYLNLADEKLAQGRREGFRDE